jgi:hypothetical protein
MEFKGRPALCAMYPVIKLASRVAKGALLGLFYGELCLATWLACLVVRVW